MSNSMPGDIFEPHDSELPDGESLEQLLEELRKKWSAHRSPEALEVILEAGEYFAEALGRFDLALAIATTVRELLADEASHHLAWAYNLEGLAYARSRRFEDAWRAFHAMRTLGQELGDEVIESTASQNLGAVALELGNLEGAREFFLRALEVKQATGDHYASVQLLVNLANLVQEESDFRNASEFLQQARDVLRAFPDDRLRASVHMSAGNLAVKQGSYVEAEEEFRKALAYARRTGQVTREIELLQNLGNVSLDQGLIGKSLRWYRRALRLAESSGDRSKSIVVHRLLGIALHRAGRNRDALSHFEEARAIAYQVGDTEQRAKATADLGALLVLLDRVEEGETFLEEALDDFRESGDGHWQGLVLRNLVVARTAKGDAQAVADTVEEALKVLSPHAHDTRRDLLLKVAEMVASDPRGGDRASEYFERALAEGREQHSQHTVAQTAYRAAQTLATVQHYSQSIRWYERALAGYQQLNDQQMVFCCRNDLAIALTELRRYREAQEQLRVCLELARRADDRVMAQQALLNLGEVLRRQGKLAEAIERLDEAAKFARSLDDLEGEATALGNLGIALRELGRLEEAEAVLGSARRLSQRSRNPSIEALAVGALGGVEFAKEHFGRALQYYRRAARLNLSVGQTVQALEDVAAVVECLSALGRVVELQEQVQRLVDLVQVTGDGFLGAVALVRSARWWLQQGALDTAADLYALALLVAGLGAANDQDETVGHVEGVMRVMVEHVQTYAEHDGDRVYESVLEILQERYEQDVTPLRVMLASTRKLGEDVEAGDPN